MKNFFIPKHFIYSTLIGFVLCLSSLSIHSCKKENNSFETEPNKTATPQNDTTKNEFTEIQNLEKRKVNKPYTENSNLPTKNNKEEELSIYLTFDDGPNRGTENLLKVLQDKQVPSTFFVVGKHISDTKKQRKIMKKLEEDSLIEIANHSYSHAHHKYAKFYNDKEGVLADFNRSRDTIRINTNIARTPGRNIWRLPNVTATDIKKSKEAADYLEKNGYKLVGWDIEWAHNKEMGLDKNHDYMIEKVDYMFKNKLEKTPKHLVLLTHDQYFRDEKSMKELSLFIEKLQKDKRYKFKKISEYPEINNVLR